MTRRWVGAVLVLALPVVAVADDDYRHGRIRHVEDGVSIQRAAEPGAEEAQPNIPFLPGDRIWTDERGRVEFQFDSGAFLRLDNGTKLDYLDNPGDRVILRLWSGGLYVHQTDRDAEFEIETPGGVVEVRGRGITRIDAHSGETRISVYEGEATLQGRRGVRIGEGERVFARDGEADQGPMAFDARDDDDFSIWADDRQERVHYARQRPANLPEYVRPYYDELYDHGSWDREEGVGDVWRPRVAVGWQPYSFGRWMWTSYGWTWIPNEPWGWAPFHYGRWGHSARGWYWIPQRQWGPAWVSWAVGGPYVGWCPLGFGNRPLIVYERRHRGGHAIPRAGRGSWIYARHGDLTARDLSRRRVQNVDPADLARVRIAPPRARLTKDLRVVEAPVAPATPRTVRTKPTPGDTVPELRGDNQTTIPFPVARRRREAEERHDRGHSFGEAAGGRGAHAAPRAPESGAAESDPPSHPRTARPAPGSGDAGRARWQGHEPGGEPARGVAHPESAPTARSRPRGDDAGTPRHAAPRQEAAPRRDPAPRQEHRAAPRERPARDESGSHPGMSAPRQREDGAQRRSAPSEHRDSGGGAARRGERAPHQEAAPAGHSGRARRQKD